MKTNKEVYTWGGKFKCVRNGKPMIQSGEAHCCYFCGEVIDFITLLPCPNCHAVKCQVCGKCFCNIKEEELVALRVLRQKYCCTTVYFKEGMESKDLWLLKYVPSFKKALDYCREQEEVI